MLKEFFRRIRLAFTPPPRAMTAKKLEKRRKENVEKIVKIILMRARANIWT